MIKTSNNHAMIQENQKLEEFAPELEKDLRIKSFSVILSLAIIAVVNLLELGYLIYCVYFFNDIAITAGGSILVGYALYSLIKFLPGIKNFLDRPFKYLTDRIEGYEGILNFLMVSLEILFCFYVLVKIVINFNLF